MLEGVPPSLEERRVFTQTSTLTRRRSFVRSFVEKDRPLDREYPARPAHVFVG